MFRAVRPAGEVSWVLGWVFWFLLGLYGPGMCIVFSFPFFFVFFFLFFKCDISFFLDRGLLTDRVGSYMMFTYMVKQRKKTLSKLEQK